MLQRDASSDRILRGKSFPPSDSPGPYYSLFDYDRLDVLVLDDGRPIRRSIVLAHDSVEHYKADSWAEISPRYGDSRRKPRPLQ